LKFLFSCLTVLTIVVSGSATSPSDSAIVRLGDLEQLCGKKWSGTLTYLDYKSAKPVDLKCNLQVVRSDVKNKWKMSYEYTDEPRANRTSDITLSDDGKMVDDETVVSRNQSKHKIVTVVTERNGLDDYKPAKMTYTYVLGTSEFSIKKEVCFEGSMDKIVRNTYSWRR